MLVSWNVTNQCNMHCKHCYRDAGQLLNEELTTEQGKSLLEEMVKAGFKIVIFSGGEPLMRSDIFELVQYAAKLKLRPVFGTNGTLIDKETAIRLKEAGAAAMGISLDSLDCVKHNAFRSYENAWQEAVEGMKNCREAGLPFQIHTTVLNWNRDEILNITDFAVEVGARGHHIFFLVPTGRAADIEEESLQSAEYEKLITDIMKKQKEAPIELKPTCAPQFMRIAHELGVKVRHSRGCLAGLSYCIISPVGEVQPCAFMKETAGNVKEIPFSQIWSGSPLLQKLRTLDYKGSCGTCAYSTICGGCRARAAVYHHGDFMAEEPWCSAGAKRSLFNHGSNRRYVNEPDTEKLSDPSQALRCIGGKTAIDGTGSSGTNSKNEDGRFD